MLNARIESVRSNCDKLGIEFDFDPLDFERYVPSIRLADLSEPRDQHAMVRLLEHYANDPAIGSPGLKEQSKRDVANDLAKRDLVRVFFVVDDSGDKNGEVVAEAESEKHVIAMAVCYELYSTFNAAPTVNIHDFMVESSWRGQGIGKQLMQAVLDDAKDRGCCSVSLEVYENNTVARATYERMGFRSPNHDPSLGRTLYLSRKVEGVR